MDILEICQSLWLICREEPTLEIETIVGSGEFKYSALIGWEKLPLGWSFLEAIGVATDSQDRVYVFNRGEHPIIVLGPEGNFLGSWGEGHFVRPHGIYIGPDDMLYLSDDRDHTVHKYTTDGERLLTLGTSGHPSDTGVQGWDYRTLTQVGLPFNMPTNLALSPDGEIYVSDGYGNARIHKFSPEGELLFSFGESGSGPGQFQLPHGIGVDSQGVVFVADRENNRLQLFSSAGEFVEEWTDLVRPCDLFLDGKDNVFVAELGEIAGLFPGVSQKPDARGAQVSIFDRQGRIQSRFGGGSEPCSSGDFFAAHDVWVDSQQSLYVGEVTMAAGGSSGMIPPDCPSLQKFVWV